MCSPLSLEGDKSVCFAWGMENTHMLRDGELRSGLFLSAKVRGRERSVCVRLPSPPQNSIYHLSELQWREVNPLFLRKQSDGGRHWD